MAELVTALGVEPGWTVAVIGGGGKMPLIERLADEWSAAGGRVLVSTTTRMFSFVPPPAWRLAVGPSVRLQPLAPGEVALVGGVEERGGLLGGLEPVAIEEHARELGADVVLVKADGARGLSIKAHREGEPPVPPRSKLVVAVAGLDAHAKPISSATVHRTELFCERWGYAAGERLDDDAYARVLGDPEGYRAAVPPGARYAVYLNQADGGEREAAARRIAAALGDRKVRVAWGDLKSGRVTRE